MRARARFSAAIFSAISVMQLAGCAGSAYGIAHEDPAILRTRSNEELCAARFVSRTEAVDAELHARHALTDDEWRHVQDKTVAIGMSKAAVVCSWGVIYEGTNGSINRTIVGDTVIEQWVYRPTPHSSPQYVYFTNGIVTALQD